MPDMRLLASLLRPQVVDVTERVSILVTHPRPLEKQSPHVQAHVFSAEDPLGPRLALLGDEAGGCVPGPAGVREEVEEGVQVLEGVVKGDKVHPGDEAVVVPLCVDGGFERQARGAEEAAEPGGEGVAVDVGEEFVPVLLLHGEVFQHGEGVVVKGAFGGWAQLDEPRVGNLVGKGAQVAAVKARAGVDGFRGEFKRLGPDARLFDLRYDCAVEHVDETLTLKVVPVVLSGAAA